MDPTEVSYSYLMMEEELATETLCSPSQILIDGKRPAIVSV
jgi:hypothetical protein